MRPVKSSLTVRLTDEQRQRLDDAAHLGPYKISITEVIARGIELAAQELEVIHNRARQPNPSTSPDKES